MPLSLFVLSLKGDRLRNFVAMIIGKDKRKCRLIFCEGRTGKTSHEKESSALKNTCRKIRSDLRKLMTDVQGFASLAEVRKGIML